MSVIDGDSEMISVRKRKSSSYRSKKNRRQFDRPFGLRDRTGEADVLATEGDQKSGPLALGVHQVVATLQ